MRVRAAFCLLLFSSFAFAAKPDCSERLSAPALSLTQVLKNAYAKRVLTAEDLKRFVEASEWGNPIASQSSNLLAGGLNRAFAMLDGQIQDADREQVKALLRKFLIDEGVQAAEAAAASEATAQVVAPREVLPFATQTYFGRYNRMSFNLDGRPVFFERGQANNSDAHYWGVFYDPFNPDTNKRVVQIPFERIQRFKDERPFYIKFKKRDLFIYPETHAVLDLSQAKNVSSEFSRDILQSIKSGVDFNLRQKPVEKRPLAWNIEDDTITFSGGGFKSVKYTLPKGAVFSDAVTPATFTNRGQTYAIIPYLEGPTKQDLEQKVLFANLNSRQRPKSFAFEHENLAGTFKNGVPYIYTFMDRGDDKMKIVFLNTEDGTIEKIQTEAELEINPAPFVIDDRHYLVWPEKRGLSVLDVDSGLQSVSPIHVSWRVYTDCISFEYQGIWYLLVPGNKGKLIQLTGTTTGK